MAVTWTIKGEAGRSVGAAERELSSMQMQGISPSFASLASDGISWQVWLRNTSQIPGLVPDYGQKITLYRNGVRYFCGHVTLRKPLFTAERFGYSLRVEGPWWWLAKTSISSVVPDQSSTASERAMYVFPAATVRTNLIALIYRAIALGLPISEGSIASTFAIQRLALSEKKFSEAFAELMGWITDGILYFDYSGADDTHPALCVQRRATATTITINPAAVCTPKIDLTPREDLLVEELSIYYARRATVDNKRLTVWDSETAGELTSGLPRRQLVTTSGPELSLWLPQDFTDSVTVRSAPINAVDIIGRFEERIRAAGGTFGVGGFTEATSSGTFTLPHITTRVVDVEGNPVDPAYSYYLAVGEPKDWWVKDGVEHVKGRLAATIYGVDLAPAGVGSYTAVPPKWFEIIGGQVYTYSVLILGLLRSKWVYSTTVSVPVVLVKKHWPEDTTLIRAEDWGWFNPPPGLAANLLATQNHVPVEGSIDVVLDDPGPGNACGCAVNVSGFLPETANMRAMVSGYSVNLRTGATSYRFNPPDRLAYRDLVNRFRQSGADNIYYLVDSVSGDPGENPPPDPELEVPVGPPNALTYNGEYLMFDGDYITFTPTPENAPTFNGAILTFNGAALTFTPSP